MRNPSITYYGLRIVVLKHPQIRMQKRHWIYLFIGLAIAIGILCVVSDYIGTPVPCQPYKGDERAACKMVYRLHNDDLIWDLTSFGPMEHPKLMASAAWKAYNTRRDLDPFLLKAIKDPQRFAIAHVLLVHRTEAVCIDHHIAEVCGLRVWVDDTGRVSYPDNNLERLYDFWETRLSQR